MIGGLCGIVGSLLSTARGGWVALPFLLVVILYIYRHSLSKRFFLTFFGIIVVASIGISQMPNNRIMERINVAQKDIQLYLDKNNGNTSLGARFEMWKSALEMAKEKPLFGWGIQGATALLAAKSQTLIQHKTVYPKTTVAIAQVTSK